MRNELDYYIAEMKAGRLRIVLGPTTPQIWTVDYETNRRDTEGSGGRFVKRRYDEYTDELYEDVLNEEEVSDIIQMFGGGRIWGAGVERAAKEWAMET